MRKKLSYFLLVIMIIIMGSMTLFGCKKVNYNDYFYVTDGSVYQDGDARFDSGFSTDNNGYDKYGQEVDRLTSVVPNKRQLGYLELEYYNFIHYGMNTFTNKEWGNGKEKPSKFNPKVVDTDQWVRVLKASGSKGIIFTAKHHDGFCLWQTKTTEHSIKNSPYMDGKGDIVKQLSDSCRKYGMKFGLYLSPWDMNCEFYGTSRYNDFFKAQLRELLDGRYGDIFSIWFDGARGKDAEMEPGFEYDMKGYEEIIHSLQPNCVAALQGSDVRWVGNEAGVSRENEWCVISEGSEASLEYQNDVAGADKLQDVAYNAEDVGSRDLLKKYGDLIFKPAEVDVSIHKGWFYHSSQKPKELDHLLKIYYKSVGGNSSLLLNVCPSKKGIIEERDAERLKEFGDAIQTSKANPIAVDNIMIGGNHAMTPMSGADMNALLSEELGTNYAFKDNEYIMDITFKEARQVKRIDLREDLRYSQRVEKFDVYAKVDGGWQIIAEAGNIGNRRILMFDPNTAITTSAIRIVIRQSRNVPMLRSVGIYA